MRHSPQQRIEAFLAREDVTAEGLARGIRTFAESPVGVVTIAALTLVVGVRLVTPKGGGLAPATERGGGLVQLTEEEAEEEGLYRV